MITSLLPWLRLLWFPLTALIALGVAVVRFRQLHAARRRGLVSLDAFRQIWAALAAATACGALLALGYIYETAFWPAALTALLSLAILVLMHAARPGTHPAVRGFFHALPRDGLEPLEYHQKVSPGGWLARWLAVLIPLAVILLLTATFLETKRTVPLAIIGLGYAAPLFVIPYKRLAYLPLVILALSGVAGWQAANLRLRLPPGRWSTPILAAECGPRFRDISENLGWCVNATNGDLYRLQLNTGAVRSRTQLEGAYFILAANAAEAWVMRDPPYGVTRVFQDQIETVTLPSAMFNIRRAALGTEGTFWVVSWTGSLFSFPEHELSVEWNRGNDIAGAVEIAPDGSVWLGSSDGASRLRPDQSGWDTFLSDDDRKVAVYDFAFGLDGSVWFLWAGEYRLERWTGPWGVSRLDLDGSLRHYDLRSLTQMGAPLSEDAIVVDGKGRLWFVAHATNPPRKVLGVLESDGTLATELLPLGEMHSTNRINLVLRTPWSREAFGVLPDGSGGVYLYNGVDEPLRHWRP